MYGTGFCDEMFGSLLCIGVDGLLGRVNPAPLDRPFDAWFVSVGVEAFCCGP